MDEDRRYAKRVNTSLPLTFRRLNQNSSRLEAEFIELDERIKGGLKWAAREQPKLATLLRLLNDKLDTLGRMLAEADAPPPRNTLINTSSSGIRFQWDGPVETNADIEIIIILAAPERPLKLLAQVVGCEPGASAAEGWQVRCRFHGSQTESIQHLTRMMTGKGT